MKKIIFTLLSLLTFSSFATDYSRFEGLYKLDNGDRNCQTYLKIYTDNSHFYVASSETSNNDWHRGVLVFQKLDDIDQIIDGDSIKFSGTMYSDESYILLPVTIPYHIKVTAYLLDDGNFHIKTNRRSLVAVGAKNRECTYSPIVE